MSSRARNLVSLIFVLLMLCMQQGDYGHQLGHLTAVLQSQAVGASNAGDQPGEGRPADIQHVCGECLTLSALGGLLSTHPGLAFVAPGLVIAVAAPYRSYLTQLLSPKVRGPPLNS